MTFIEKSAWFMSLALIGAGGFYAREVLASSAALDGTAPPNIGLIAFLTIGLVAFAIFGHAVAALGNPADADQPEDERDARVAQRSGNIAGYVLGAAVMSGIWSYALIADGNLLFHILVLGLVVSQISDYGLSIWFYRRGV